MATGLCAGLLLTGSSSLWAAEATTPQSSVKTYTLADIKTFSEINAIEVLRQKAAKDVKEADAFNAEMNYYDARYQSSNPGGFSMMDPYQFWLQWDSALQTFKDAEDTLEEVQRQAGFAGESRFFAFQQMLQSRASLGKTIELQEQLLEIEKLKVQLGMNIPSAVTAQALKISELKSSLIQLDLAQALAAKELMRQIGQPIDTEFILADLEAYPVLKEKYILADLITTATKNSLSLKQLDRAIESLDDKIDEGGLSVPIKEQLAAQANSLKLTRKEVQYAIKLVAQNSINALEQADLKATLLKEKLEKAELDEQHMALQVKLGLAAKISLPATELALLTAQNDYQKVLDDRYLSLRTLSLLEQGIMVSTGSAAAMSE